MAGYRKREKINAGSITTSRQCNGLVLACRSVIRAHQNQIMIFEKAILCVAGHFVATADLMVS